MVEQTDPFFIPQPVSPPEPIPTPEPLPVPEPEFEEESEPDIISRHITPQQTQPEQTEGEGKTYFEEKIGGMLNGGDMSDMFEVPKWDDADMRSDDLLSLDPDEDVMDYDPDGSFDSLLTVNSEDILGDDFPGSKHNTIPSGKVRYRRTRKPYHPTNPFPDDTLGEMRY